MSFENGIEAAWNRLGPSLVRDAKACGLDVDEEGHIGLACFGRAVLVDPHSRCITCAGGEALPGNLAIMVLDYLARLSVGERTGRWISFHEIPGTFPYQRAFEERAVDRLAAEAGRRLRDFARAAQSLGATEVGSAGTAFLFWPLPRIPVLLRVWPGEEGLESGAVILFDSGIGEQLSCEVIAVLGEYLIAEIVSVMNR